MTGVLAAVLLSAVLALLAPVQAQTPVGVEVFQPIPECIMREPGDETPIVSPVCSDLDLGTTTLICSANGFLRDWMLDGTTWAEGSVINECSFSASDLSGMTFTNGEIAVQGATVVSFDDCNLSGLSIVNSRGRIEIRGSRSTAENINLSGGEFNQTQFLNGILFDGINMKDTVFRDVLFDGLNGEGLENGLELTDDRLVLNELNAENVEMRGGGNRFRWSAITGSASTMVGIQAEGLVFEFCDMEGTDLTSANFKSGNITDSTFEGVTMKQTILDKAGVKNWRIVDSKVSELQMSGSFYVDDCGGGKCPTIEVTGSNISDSLFFNSDLRRGKFVDSMIDGCTFTSAQFYADGDGGNFSGSTFSRTTEFIGTDLRNADFTNAANLDSVLFTDAFMGGVIGLPNDQDCEAFCARKGCLCEGPEDEYNYYDDDGDDGVEPACFPGSSVVTVVDESGAHFQKSLSHLQVGDMVKDGSGKHGSQIFFFSHRDANAQETFLEIETENGLSLTVTAGHYVYTGEDEMLLARNVEPLKHSLVRSDGSLSLVSSVRKVRIPDGLYAPHSISGDLVVDGFKVSCYTEAVPPKLGHVLLLPIKAVGAVMRAVGLQASIKLGGRSTYIRPILRVLYAVTSQFMVR